MSSTVDACPLEVVDRLIRLPSYPPCHDQQIERVVLTGYGGGVFPVRSGSGEGSVTTVVADVADDCRMAAQLSSRLEADIEGRQEVAHAFFAAAATIAV